MTWGLTIPERVRLIIRAFAEDSEKPTFENVGKRFLHETGTALDRDAYESAMKKERSK